MADWSSTARSLSTVPSTGATSPCRIRRRSPGTISSRGTSSSAPSRCRVAVRGTRERRSRISRRARPSAKLSRNVPPEYISATTAAASVSPKTSAADMDRAATMSRPTSPLHRLRIISTKRAARTGMTPATQTISARSSLSGDPQADPHRQAGEGNDQYGDLDLSLPPPLILGSPRSVAHSAAARSAVPQAFDAALPLHDRGREHRVPSYGPSRCPPRRP